MLSFWMRIRAGYCIVFTAQEARDPPVPAKVTGDVEARIIALAYSEPPKGYARWSIRVLAKKSVELGMMDSLSRMTVSRLL